MLRSVRKDRRIGSNGMCSSKIVIGDCKVLSKIEANDQYEIEFLIE